jgi:acyl carrier protein
VDLYLIPEARLEYKRKIEDVSFAGVRLQESEIYQKLTPIFRQVFNNNKIAVTPNLSADDVDGWDSLRNIRLILSVEKAFNLKFSASDVDKLECVGDLVYLVKSRL